MGTGALGIVHLGRRERRREHDAGDRRPHPGSDLACERDARRRSALAALRAVGQHRREQRGARDPHPQPRERVGRDRDDGTAGGDRHHEGGRHGQARPQRDLVPRPCSDPRRGHRPGRPPQRAEQERDPDHPHAVAEPDLELERQVGLGAEERDPGPEGGDVGGDRVGGMREHRLGRPPLVEEEPDGRDQRQRCQHQRREPVLGEREEHRDDQPEQHRAGDVEACLPPGALPRLNHAQGARGGPRDDGDQREVDPEHPPPADRGGEHRSQGRPDQG